LRLRVCFHFDLGVCAGRGGGVRGKWDVRCVSATRRLGSVPGSVSSPALELAHAQVCAGPSSARGEGKRKAPAREALGGTQGHAAWWQRTRATAASVAASRAGQLGRMLPLRQPGKPRGWLGGLLDNRSIAPSLGRPLGQLQPCRDGHLGHRSLALSRTRTRAGRCVTASIIACPLRLYYLLLRESLLRRTGQGPGCTRLPGSPGPPLDASCSCWAGWKGAGNGVCARASVLVWRASGRVSMRVGARAWAFAGARARCLSMAWLGVRVRAPHAVWVSARARAVCVPSKRARTSLGPVIWPGARPGAHDGRPCWGAAGLRRRRLQLPAHLLLSPFSPQRRRCAGRDRLLFSHLVQLHL
jgi:hypothetical protein